MASVRRGWRDRKRTTRPNARRQPSRAGLHASRRIVRASIRKKAGRLVLVALTIGGLGVLAWEFGPMLREWVTIKEITVEGVHQVTRQEILDRLGVRAGDTMLSVSPTQMAGRVEAHPWIKRAGVRREFPDRLAVTVTERRPAAVVSSGSNRGASLLVDREAAVLGSVGTTALPDLPVLVGVNAVALGRADPPVRDLARAAIHVAELLGQDFQGTAEIHVGESSRIEAVLDGLRFQFGPEPIDRQWERFEQVRQVMRSAGRPEAEKIQGEIDLRYPGKVIVRERG